MKLKTSKLPAACLSALILVTTACSPSGEELTVSEANHAVEALLLSEAPVDSLSVFEARKQAQPGAPIQVTGQIGGTLHPFVQGYASFVLADPSLEFCDEMGDDHCSTPWDACCEDPDKLKSMRIYVQFLDSTGIPIQSNLKESIGIKELDQVTVVGTVAESSTSTNTIINATSLYK